MADDDIVEETGAEQADGGPEVQIGNRYHILVGSRLPDLDFGNAQAVAVRDEHYPEDLLFARICAPNAQPRLAAMANLRHMSDASILRPLDWGPVAWPGASRKRIAVVFARPEHGALMTPRSHTCAPIPTDELTRRVIAPAVLTLGLFTQRGMTHRSIRPDNIYWSNDNKTGIMLGDCVTDAPGLTQPVLYEPINSAMTPPIGRGEGLIADDFYALGATLLVLSTGQCALFGAKDSEIIEAKLARGSYAALNGNGRTPFGLRELLRGLLADDPIQRWGLEQLEQWLGGGLRSSVQDAKRSPVARPFRFDGKEYANVRMLANAFGRNGFEATRAIADPEFEKWLERGVVDSSITSSVRDVIRRSPGRSVDARALAQICASLDPEGPIRYKGMIAMAPALGEVLADAFLRKDNERIAVVADAISKGISVDWYAIQPIHRQVRYEEKIAEFKQLQTLLRHNGIGYGIERCLYALNPSFPCISDVLGGRYITVPREILPALEEIVQSAGSLLKLMDRHLVAFIASRVKMNLDRRLALIEAVKGDSTASKLAMLGILAMLQSRYGPSQLPFLTEWLARDLDGAVGRINSKSTRDVLRKRLTTVAGGGNLIDLNACLNNEKVMRADQAGRKQAMREFAAATREIGQLESKEFEDSTQVLAWKIGTGISTCVAVASVAFATLT